MALELEFEETRMKRQMEEQQKAKLPKLHILKSDCTVTYWVQFWEHFEEETDKCKHFTAITKFSYLRELLSNQPKTKITGLPFNEEGYGKWKSKDTVALEKWENIRDYTCSW